MGGNHGSDLIPGPGTPYAIGWTKEKEKKKLKNYRPIEKAWTSDPHISELDACSTTHCLGKAQHHLTVGLLMPTLQQHPKQLHRAKGHNTEQAVIKYIAVSISVINGMSHWPWFVQPMIVHVTVLAIWIVRALCTWNSFT